LIDKKEEELEDLEKILVEGKGVERMKEYFVGRCFVSFDTE